MSKGHSRSVVQIAEGRNDYMKKVYLDMTQATMCIGAIVADAEVIPAGAVVSSMSVRHKNEEYQRYADEYDIHFIFDDNVPAVDFYTIPMVEIFATDSEGGYIGSAGQAIDLQKEIPICYIDREKSCFLIAESGKEFLDKVTHWRSQLRPYAEIEFYGSLEDAQKKYEFLDRAAMEQEMKEVQPKGVKEWKENIPE